MRILLAAIHYPVSCARNMLWALRDLGHEVITLGDAMGTSLPWAKDGQVAPWYEWNPDIPLERTDDSDFMQAVGAWALAKLEALPDLVLQLDRTVRGIPAANVLYAIDNHVGQYSGHAEFDKIFIAHSWGHMRELPQASWLVAAHDPRYAHVIDASAPRPIDVLLCGNPYAERVALVKSLREQGINAVGTCGHIYEEYNRLYNQAKIALIHSNCGDVSTRFFENLAQGCLVVTDRCADLERCGYAEWQHYVGYERDDPVECGEIIKFALKTYDRPWARHMRQEAIEAVKADTWTARAQAIISCVSS